MDKAHNKNFELCNDNVYIGNKDILKLYCYKCCDYFYMNWNNISNGYNCSLCRDLSW